MASKVLILHIILFSFLSCASQMTDDQYVELYQNPEKEMIKKNILLSKQFRSCADKNRSNSLALKKQCSPFITDKPFLGVFSGAYKNNEEKYEALFHSLRAGFFRCLLSKKDVNTVSDFKEEDAIIFSGKFNSVKWRYPRDPREKPWVSSALLSDCSFKKNQRSLSKAKK